MFHNLHPFGNIFLFCSCHFQSWHNLNHLNCIHYRLSPSSESCIHWGDQETEAELWGWIPGEFQKATLLMWQFTPPGIQHQEWRASPCNTPESSLLKRLPLTALQSMCIVRPYGKYIGLQASHSVGELYTASAKCNNVFLIPLAGEAHAASFI